QYTYRDYRTAGSRADQQIPTNQGKCALANPWGSKSTNTEDPGVGIFFSGGAGNLFWNNLVPAEQFPSWLAGIRHHLCAFPVSFFHPCPCNYSAGNGNRAAQQQKRNQ